MGWAIWDKWYPLQAGQIGIPISATLCDLRTNFIEATLLIYKSKAAAIVIVVRLRPRGATIASHFPRPPQLPKIIHISYEYLISSNRMRYELGILKETVSRFSRKCLQGFLLNFILLQYSSILRTCILTTFLTNLPEKIGSQIHENCLLTLLAEMIEIKLTGIYWIYQDVREKNCLKSIQSSQETLFTRA